jgi:hypothetical protein
MEPSREPREPFEVKIWTSSHGLAHHYFPQQLEKAYKHEGLLRFPEIDAVSGRVIDEQFVDIYREDFEKIKDSPNPQISILLLGDNNIRQYALMGAFRVWKHTLEIIELHKGTCYPLLICGVMPSPQTDAQTRPVSEYLDDRLKTKINELRKQGRSAKIFGHFNSYSFFAEPEGYIIANKYFAPDGIHLNELGAYELASNMLLGAKILAEVLLEYP